MISKKEFIEDLLEKSKDIEDGLFLPNQVELKISELEKFSPIVAMELSKIEEIILTKRSETYGKFIEEEEYTVKLIEYDNDSIRFCPIALKNYMKKQ